LKSPAQPTTRQDRIFNRLGNMQKLRSGSFQVFAG
jgi:hypothetical protein